MRIRPGWWFVTQLGNYVRFTSEDSRGVVKLKLEVAAQKTLDDSGGVRVTENEYFDKEASSVGDATVGIKFYAAMPFKWWLKEKLRALMWWRK